MTINTSKNVSYQNVAKYSLIGVVISLYIYIYKYIYIYIYIYIYFAKKLYLVEKRDKTSLIFLCNFE